MGPFGKLSRVLNGFMTPVSHPSLPAKAAPGQLSASEIRQALALTGQLEPLAFYLFGKPISTSRSPALHNALFQQTGLPHNYSIFETDRAEEVRDLIRSPHFGGASVTMPLKLDILPLLDELSEAAKVIGAVNTIIPSGSPNEKGSRLLGDNTDWMGMVFSLRSANLNTSPAGSRGSGAVIGSGGTTRAAIYALHALGYSPIYIVARNPARVKDLIDSFPTAYGIQLLNQADHVLALATPPIVIISTIPADMPLDLGIKDTVVALLQRPERSSHHGVLLEMAYKPRHTPAMELAEDAGWQTIPGLEVLSSQGWYQVRQDLGLEAIHHLPPRP